jgi:hypothetical protein
MDFLRQIFQTTPTFIKIGFEDIKITIEKIKYNPTEYILINTMPYHFQNNLIHGTLNTSSEESVINRILDNYEMSRVKIVLYGLNSTDETVEKKAHQLQTLGFSEIYLYLGGMFEWGLLQELYGSSEFPTTGIMKPVDIIKYRPDKKLDIPRIGY